MVQEPATEKDWELESGLPNDIDGYMVNCHFGKKEQYMDKVTVIQGAEDSGLMFLCDLVDADGNYVAQAQGWTVGTGWTPSDDGLTVTHPTHHNIIMTSKYGELIGKVSKGLGVKMFQYGRPTNASTWEGLGFHWMLKEYVSFREKGKPVEEQKKSNILEPSLFLGKKEFPNLAPAGAEAAGGLPAAAAVAAPEEVMAALQALVDSSGTAQSFQLKAMKIPGVASNEELMQKVLNPGADGFYATHKKK